MNDRYWVPVSEDSRFEIDKTIKGEPKKTSFFKIWCAICSWTVGPRRLSFSGHGVLISRPSPEKDSLLGPTVHEQLAHQILKKEVFIAPKIIKTLKRSCADHETFHTTRGQSEFSSIIDNTRRNLKQVLYITVGATVESSVPLHYIHLSFSDDWFDNRK